jgi:hypothetical protein
MRQKVRRSRGFKGLGRSGQKAKGDRRAFQPGNAAKSKPIDYHLAHLSARAYSLLAIVEADENFAPRNGCVPC